MTQNLCRPLADGRMIAFVTLGFNDDVRYDVKIDLFQYLCWWWLIRWQTVGMVECKFHGLCSRDYGAHWRWIGKLVFVGCFGLEK
jgi:hypothetical protein